MIPVILGTLGGTSAAIVLATALGVEVTPERLCLWLVVNLITALLVVTLVDGVL